MKISEKIKMKPLTKPNIQIIDIRILYRYLLRVVIPPFLVSFALFTFFVETLDILVNLIRYLDRGITLFDILRLQWLYLPTSLSYALPVAILFSVTFSIGQLYANNELIAVFVSGVSLLKFVIPLILLGIVLSVGNFYFKEEVVIQTFREKNELTRIFLNQNLDRTNSHVAILQDGGNIVYYTDLYDDVKKELHRPIIIVTDSDNNLIYRLNASIAVWNEKSWVFKEVNLYRFNALAQDYSLEHYNTFTDPALISIPENFQRVISNVDEMPYNDALAYIEKLKNSGYPYQKLLTDTYARIPLSLSPFIVMIAACLSGSVFRKNTLLMSLLNALVAAVIYYSADLVGSVMAARGILPPIIGSWLGFFATMLLSITIYKLFIK